MNFTFQNYKNILSKVLKKLRPAFFEDYSQSGKVYLRHDVDIFAENIINIANIEKDFGAKSIYFFQPNSEFYNMLSPSISKIIMKLNDQGHQIGLHVDAKLVSSKEELYDHVNSLYNFYSKYIPLSKTISFHRPPNFVIGDFEIEGFINVYMNKYFKNIRYFSDSKRRWFGDQLLESIKSDDKTSIQLLTHPYWWDHISFNLLELMERYKYIQNIKIERELRRGFEPYKVFIDERFGRSL